MPRPMLRRIRTRERHLSALAARALAGSMSPALYAASVRLVYEECR